MSDFAIGDIVRVRVDPQNDEHNLDLPAGDGWEAIVVDVDENGDLELAWLSRFTTQPTLPRGSPMKETWDDRTSVVQPGVDADVALLKRAKYEVIEVGK